MKKNKIILVLIMIFLIITISSCTKDSSNSNPKHDESKITIQIIEEFETALIDIMSQVDLVPYYEKQIAEKKLKEEEKKQMEILTGTKSKEEEETEQKSKVSNEEFKPGPITINDIVLSKILEQETSYKAEEQEEIKIPDDIKYVWHEINNTINDLHLKWDNLKPKLKQSAVSSKAISGFEETLNGLTISGSKNNYLETLIKANALTSFIPQFINDLKDNIMASIYSVKYHTRQIVLDSVNNNYNNVNNNIDIIKNDEKILTAELMKKKSKDLVEKLTESISNLENAILLKDINVIKIKVSIIIKNINSIKEKILMD